MAFVLKSIYVLVIAIFLVLLAFVRAEDCPIRDEDCIDKYQREDEDGNFIFDYIVPISPKNGKSISEEISSDQSIYEPTKNALDNLKNHFEALFQEQRERNVTRSETSDGSVDGLCTLGIDPRIKNRAKYYGFGWPEDCGYEFKGDSEVRKELLRENKELRSAYVTENIEHLVAGLNSVKDRAVLNYGLGWDESYVNDAMEREDDQDYVRSCTGYRSLAFKVKGKWAIAGKLQKRPWDYYAPSREKQVLTELISVEEGGLAPLTLRLPICDKCANVKGYKNSTASLWYGSQNDDHKFFWEKYHRDLTKHPALELALAISEHEKELVEDSGAISNAAILILPVFLTILPLGLFQEVSGKFLIVYSCWS